MVVHILGVRDPIRDFTDETFFLGGVDRPAQGDLAINGCAAQAMSKSYWEQAKRDSSKPASVVVLADRPTAGTLLLSR